MIKINSRGEGGYKITQSQVVKIAEESKNCFKSKNRRNKKPMSKIKRRNPKNLRGKSITLHGILQRMKRKLINLGRFKVFGGCKGEIDVKSRVMKYITLGLKKLSEEVLTGKGSIEGGGPETRIKKVLGGEMNEVGKDPAENRVEVCENDKQNKTVNSFKELLEKIAKLTRSFNNAIIKL